MTQSIRDTISFKNGRSAEQRVVKWLQDRGWNVIPSYDYAGPDQDRPPRLQGRSLRAAIPDVDACRRGTRCWIEIKGKTKPSLTHLTGELEHGFSSRLCQHYLVVERESGTPVYVIVHEMDNKRLLCASLKFLCTFPLWPVFAPSPRGKMYHRRSNSVRMGAMIFWPVHAFKELGALP